MSTRRACIKCGVNRGPRSYSGPRGKVCLVCQKQTRRKSSRTVHLRTTYDITQEEYDAILTAQGGVCGGCGETRRYLLHVDHDHAIERDRGVRASVRGLLCKRCNQTLRRVGDNAAVLRGLALYLQLPPARGVLDAVVGDALRDVEPD